MKNGALQRWYAGALAVLLLIVAMPDVMAESVSAAQRRAATDYLAALGVADAQQLAFAIHPDELDRLRLGVQQRLREDAARGDTGSHARLFGDAMTLVDIERLTSVNFFRTLARGVDLRTTPRYEELRALGVVREGKLAHVMLRGKVADAARQEQRQDLELVSLLPYGREWKATLPTAFEARVEDLLLGRGESPPPVATGSSPASAQSPSLPSTPQILELLAAAERALLEGRCDRYYREYLSPTLQRSLGTRTLDTLISGCNRSIATRELLIAALRVVRRTPPVYAAGGVRASYDVTGQGLPFDRFLLEQEQGRWYIAE
jgi:hypothetical protein